MALDVTRAPELDVCWVRPGRDAALALVSQDSTALTALAEALTLTEGSVSILRHAAWAVDELPPAEAVRAAHPDILDLPADEALNAAWDVAYPIQLAQIQDTLERFHVVFDVWFSERALHDAGAVEQAVGQGVEAAAFAGIRPARPHGIAHGEPPRQ